VQGSSDLDVARGSNAKSVLEHHWDAWVTEADWEYLARHGINTVRIPVRLKPSSSTLRRLLSPPQIGYYHLCGTDGSVIQGTEFAQFGNVYEGAWGRITNAIATAHRYGIGVLIGECRV
jgi:glucan 1,3-beta-glucosidase